MDKSLRGYHFDSLLFRITVGLYIDFEIAVRYELFNRLSVYDMTYMYDCALTCLLYIWCR